MRVVFLASEGAFYLRPFEILLFLIFLKKIAVHFIRQSTTKEFDVIKKRHHEHSDRPTQRPISVASDVRASISSQMSTDCFVRFSCLLIHYSLHSLYSLLLTIFRDVIDERGIDQEDPSWLSG